MSTRRLSIALLLFASATTSAAPADACCLTDWLFGRRASPYAAGYTPYGPAYAPYSAGYAPVQVLTTPIGTTPYDANFPYAANYASGYTALPLSTPAYASGAYQLQRPTYLDNPSVYTGMPTGVAQAGYTAPVINGYRGGASAATSGYLGSANQYPSSPVTNAYSANYPSNVIPTTQIAPPFGAVPQQPVGGGLSRFFGSLFGTNYNTSYYSAPVTYYRPVTSIDPVMDTTVTTQQPCTSTIQQVQRTPYSSFQVGQAAPIYGQPATDCQTPAVYGQPAYSQPTYGQSSYDQPVYGQPAYGGVSQAGAMEAAPNQYASPNQFTVPIPSTAPADGGYGVGAYDANPGSYYGQTSTAPLTGSPAAPRTQSGGDLAPLDQPRLEMYRPSEPAVQPTLPPVSTQPREAAPKSYWQLQDADNSTAMTRAEPSRDPISLSVPSFTAAEPIRAPEFEPSPFATPSKPATSFDAPPLPAARSYNPADANSASVRSTGSGTPVREAALVRQQPARPEPVRQQSAPEPQRDSRWFTVQP